jgi:hypothetical protein
MPNLNRGIRSIGSFLLWNDGFLVSIDFGFSFDFGPHEQHELFGKTTVTMIAMKKEKPRSGT